MSDYIRLRALTPVLKRQYRRCGFRCQRCRESFVAHQVMRDDEIIADVCRVCSKRALQGVVAAALVGILAPPASDAPAAVSPEAPHGGTP